MAVAAELVVGRHDVRLVAADEPGQPAGGLVEVGLPEAARVAVAVGAHHLGVAVAEVLPLGDAEDAHRPLELAGPDLAEAAVVVRRVHLGDDDLAELAAGAGHEDDAMAGRDRLGHRPAGPDRLVVGVGVDGHQGRAMRPRVVGGHGHRDASAPRYFRAPVAIRPSGATIQRPCSIASRDACAFAFSKPRRRIVERRGRDRAPDRGEVDFVAYGEDCILSGRTVLDSDRLIGHAQRPRRVRAHRRRRSSASTTASRCQIDDVVVARDELLPRPRQRPARRRRPAAADDAAAPSRSRWARTRSAASSTPCPASIRSRRIRRRKAMVPLTEVRIEYVAPRRASRDRRRHGDHEPRAGRLDRSPSSPTASTSRARRSACDDPERLAAASSKRLTARSKRLRAERA